MDSDWERKVSEFRLKILTGNTEKIFEEDYVVLDIVKALYNEDIDIWIKTELLILIEEYGCSSAINVDSVDQIVASMLDVFQQFSDRESHAQLACQILVTSTSLLIVYEQLETDICKRVTQTLLSIATSSLNSVEKRRMRSTCIQCLLQLEKNKNGILWKERDVLMGAMKKERTDLYQDYVLLVTKVIENALCVHHHGNGLTEKQNGLDRQTSLDSQENRQLVSLVIDNIGLFTPCGLWHITLSLISMVQNFPEISPTIFKPMMLHYMASMDILMVHLVLYIQREFEKEVLSEMEENQLTVRTVVGVNHPSLTPAQRLFYCHWIEHITQPGDAKEAFLPELVTQKHKLAFYPQPFDPVDCQLAKMCLLNKCFESFTTKEDGIAAGLLLGSVGYLHKLLSHTGSDRPAVALFRGLFQMYQKHCSKSFSQDINRFLRGLISGFPFFIPHALDFIECLRETTPDSPVYREVLSLLHHQIVSTPENQASQYYTFYLQVLKRASFEKDLAPEGTLKFLRYLTEHAESIDNSSWSLGSGILSVCHNLLLCHGTHGIYDELTDLLYDLMIRYRDTDVRDRARFYYMLVTSATDGKIKRIIQPILESQSYHQALSALLPEKQENAGYSHVTVLDIRVLVCERSKLQPETYITGSPDSDSKVSDPGNLDEYNQRINKNSTVLKAVYNLRLSSKDFDVVHAVCFHIEKDNNYEEIQEIYLARIQHSDCLEVDVDFKPTLPIPTSFKVWAEFINKTQTFRCDLLPLTIDFADLVLPLPFHLFKDNCKLEVFDKLWQWMLEDSKIEGSNCIKSVKIVHKQLDEFLTTTCKCLSACIIQQNEDTMEAKIGISLPPSYHLLLHIKDMKKKYLVVTMVMDTHTILLHIDKFLSE